MNTTEQIIWSFPGGTGGLALAAIALAAIAAISYKYTLRTLPTRPKTILATIRTLFLLAILLCLCDPSKVRKTSPPPAKGKKKVAVIIDSSSSMGIKGFSGKSRYKEALEYWNYKIKPVDKYKFKLFTFDEKTRATPDFPIKTNAKPAIKKTLLFDSIELWTGKLENEGFDAAIYMTDGIDTSGKRAKNALATLATANIKTVFVPIATPLPNHPVASVMKLECPTTAKPGASVATTALVGISGIQEKTNIEFIVRGPKGKVVFAKKIHGQSTGFSTTPLAFDIPVDCRGIRVFKGELRLDGKITESFAWSVRGVKNEKRRILLYQGGLDWGTRFLRGVFGRNENTQLDVRFAPRSFGHVANTLIEKFPYKSLDDYDLVIAMKIKRSQIDARMGQGLKSYIQKGGGILFIIANTIDAAGYAKSPLESFLPVKFESHLNPETAYDAKTQFFLKRMREYHAATAGNPGGAAKPLKVPPLHTMKLTEEGKHGGIFKYLASTAWNDKTPRFQDFALVRERKPGARILATHPKIQNRIILATQRFGEGRSAALACDPLWRWKLSIDSKNQAFDLFWKNLVNWLCAGHKNQPHWRATSRILKPNQTNTLTFILPARAGMKLKDLKFSVIDMKTKTRSAITLFKGEKKTEHVLKFTPKSKRNYQFIAMDKHGSVVALAWFSSGTGNDNMETLFLKPNWKILEKLADASDKHVVIRKNENFDWNKFLPDPPPMKEEVIEKKPLWHSTWLFSLILALFLAELLTRRFFKLL